MAKTDPEMRKRIEEYAEQKGISYSSAAAKFQPAKRFPFRVVVLLLGALALTALAVIAFLTPHSRPPTPDVAACVNAKPAFVEWLTRQEATYGEDLHLRYGIVSVTATCGDVTVATRIDQSAPGYDLARAACNLLSESVGQVPEVESVTVKYGSGGNACFEWPGGPAHFE